MRMAVLGRILITPLIWFVGLFLVGFLWPSAVGFLNNNIAFSLGSSFRWVAIILSLLSARLRSDFIADFDEAYQEFYTGREAQR